MIMLFIVQSIARITLARLQEDLNTLSARRDHRGMPLDESKCKHMAFARRAHIEALYKIGNHITDIVSEYQSAVLFLTKNEGEINTFIPQSTNVLLYSA